MYKFKGSVENIGDVLVKYQLIPAGNPTVNDVVVGTYDFNGIYIKQNTVIPPSGAVKAPVQPVTLSPGTYHIGSIFAVVNGVGFTSGATLNITEMTTITEIYFPLHSYGLTFEEEMTLDRDTFFDCICVGDEYYNDGTEICDVYNETSTGINYAWTGSSWDALGGSVADESVKKDIENLKENKADKSSVYTKSEVNTELNKKVNKSDLANVYKFMGSVETFDDLPHRYTLIPNIDVEKGLVPKLNDQPLSNDLYKYDKDTHAVTINDVFLGRVDVDRIIIPIVPISIKAGKYFTDSVYYGNAYIGNLCTYECGAGGDTYVDIPEQTIDHIEIFTPYGEETISGTTNSIGTLDKITDSWLIDGWGNYPRIPNGAYDNGAVYNVNTDGMNYAWTGIDWDALGTSHIDSEARKDIEELNIKTDELQSNINSIYSIADEANSRSQDNMRQIDELHTQMGDIETALDSIIAIQNSLIGGDSV